MASKRKLDESHPPLPPPRGRCSPTSADDTMWYLRIAVRPSPSVCPIAPCPPSPSQGLASLDKANAAAAVPSCPAGTSPDPPSSAPSLVPATLAPACTEHYILLSGSLEDVHPYSAGLVDWLLDISLLAFGPYAAGVFRCHRNDTAAYWSTKALEPSRWRDVKRGEQMEAKVYEFTPDDDGTTVSPRCLERTKSTASTGYRARVRENPSEFHRQVVLRDETCVITEMRVKGCVASHLIPERMGDVGVQEIVRVFQRPDTPQEDPTSYHKSDPRIGVLAAAGMYGNAIDGFRLGFKATSVQGTYTIHVFDPEGFDALDNVFVRRPIIHSATITFRSSVSSPTPLAFDWHYLQCAFQRFGTTMSRDPMRCYHVEPRRERHSDDEEEDDPWYPSAEAEAVFRPYLEQQQKNALAREIRQWNEGVDASGEERVS